MISFVMPSITFAERWVIIMNEKIKKEDIFSALDIEFVERIYSTIVEEGSQTYEELFVDYCTKVNEESEWRLYQELNESQKREYMNLIRMVIIDTIAEIFGILDGSSQATDRKKSTLGKVFDCTVSINDINVESKLKEILLALLEEYDKNYKYIDL